MTEPADQAVNIEQLAAQAVDAVRTLNRATHPDQGALRDLGEAVDLIGALSCLTGQLPQLLRQLDQWLAAELRAGRLRVDARSTAHGPDATAGLVAASLARAGRSCQQAGRSLDVSRQQLAQLASAPEGAEAAVPSEVAAVRSWVTQLWVEDWGWPEEA